MRIGPPLSLRDESRLVERSSLQQCPSMVRPRVDPHSAPKVHESISFTCGGLAPLLGSSEQQRGDLHALPDRRLGITGGGHTLHHPGAGGEGEVPSARPPARPLLARGRATAWPSFDVPPTSTQCDWLAAVSHARYDLHTRTCASPVCGLS